MVRLCMALLSIREVVRSRGLRHAARIDRGNLRLSFREAILRLNRKRVLYVLYPYRVLTI